MLKVWETWSKKIKCRKSPDQKSPNSAFIYLEFRNHWPKPSLHKKKAVTLAGLPAEGAICGGGWTLYACSPQVIWELEVIFAFKCTFPVRILVGSQHSPSDLLGKKRNGGDCAYRWVWKTFVWKKISFLQNFQNPYVILCRESPWKASWDYLIKLLFCQRLSCFIIILIHEMQNNEAEYYYWQFFALFTDSAKIWVSFVC